MAPGPLRAINSRKNPFTVSFLSSYTVKENNVKKFEVTLKVHFDGKVFKTNKIIVDAKNKMDAEDEIHDLLIDSKNYYEILSIKEVKSV